MALFHRHASVDQATLLERSDAAANALVRRSRLYIELKDLAGIHRIDHTNSGKLWDVAKFDALSLEERRSALNSLNAVAWEAERRGDRLGKKVRKSIRKHLKLREEDQEQKQEQEQEASTSEAS